MTFLYVVLLLSAATLLVAGVAEQRRHVRHLHRVPHRVLVNGIRGKSSITRLCAGALRGGGLVTVAKTTGTAARFIYPDGSEEPVYRKFGIANVVEQIAIVRRAVAFRPDALVVECMAVQPELQEINQTKLIQSTIGVLCNVREDHLAEMGPTLDDVARALCRSMPVGGVCVTAERERLPILREEAAKRHCTLVAVDPDVVTDAELARFGWVTFKENVAVALTVAELLRVNRTSALEGMWAAQPDPGVLTVRTHVAGTKILKVANVFAANDPESTLLNIDRLVEQRAISRPLHLVINCRPDRVERNQQMGALVAEVDPDRVVLIGAPTRSAQQAIPPRWRDRVVDLGGARSADALLRGVVDGVADAASLVAIGNLHGQGEVLLDALHTLPELPAAPTPPAPPTPPATRIERPPQPGALANILGALAPAESASRRAPTAGPRDASRPSRYPR